MPTVTSKLREVTNPDVVAWEWSDTYHGEEFDGVEGTYHHQIVWMRGVHKLFYVTRAPGRSKWSPWVPIVNPERFGFAGTLQSARDAAHNFYNQGETP